MFFSNKMLVFVLVSFAMLMEALDANILNTAVPVISHDFSVSPIDLKIALIGYLLSLAVFIPISGWVADKLGIKPVFIVALIVFTGSSFLCGLSTTLLQLVVFRSLQGVGGAFMTLGRLIIARTYQGFRLVEAMNTVVMVMAVGVMLGPFVGGFIVDQFSWSWIFWVNVPVGLLLVGLAMYALDKDAVKKVSAFDWLGFFLFGAGLALLCFCLAEMSNSGVNWRALLWKTLLAVFLLIAYFLRAKKQKAPLIAARLFEIRTFRISVIANLCSRMGFGSLSFLLPLFQQVGLGFSAQFSGLLMAPMAFGVIASKLFASKVLRRVGYRPFLLVNTLIMVFILWSYQLITMHTSVYWIALLTFIFGFFVSAQYTATNSLALAEISQEDLSASTSITNTNQVVALTFAVAVAAILLRVFSTLDARSALSIAVFHHVFMALGFIALISAAIFLLLRPGDGQKMLEK